MGNKPLMHPSHSGESALKPAALSGIRVLDLSRVLAGPWASQTLGDLGAEIIKVERPQTGDDTRGWGPPYLKDGEGEPTSDAAYYLCTNRNKKSIAIDIATPNGQLLVRDIAKQCDVVIENFKVGSLQQYGLDYQSLRAINPQLIYCSITGFGHTGPYAQRAGYDFLIQGMGGLMSITGHPGMGNAHPNTVPYQDFATADGHMILAIGNDGQFARFCDACGHPELSQDESYRTNTARLANRVSLIDTMRKITSTRTTSAWVELLESVGVPCGPINTIADVFADPQVKSREMQIAMDHVKAGPIALVASPIRLSETPVQYRYAPPTLGQHTREILRDYLQLTDEVMDELFLQGVLA